MKTSTTTKNELQHSLFNSRIHLEEELHSIQTIIPTWETTERINTLENTIATRLSMGTTNEELLNNDLQISKRTELTLNNIKLETINYATTKKTHRGKN